MELLPRLTGMAALAVPLVTVLRLVPVLPTSTVALDTFSAGVSLTYVTAFATDAV